MAITAFWTRFGETILSAPRLTLAAFLGHAPSVEVARQHGLRFPKSTDFQIDPAYDPNFHKLDLGEDWLQSAFLLRCVSAWGGEALVRAASVCSLLQLAHHAACDPEMRPLRNKAAFALQTLVDEPTPAARDAAMPILRECQARYKPYEFDPDSDGANVCWQHLGAPWFGLETALGNLKARADCGENEPAPANSGWCSRETVWPVRAAEAVSNFAPGPLVRDAIRAALVAWATAKPPEARKDAAPE